jgi:uridine kinase
MISSTSNSVNKSRNAKPKNCKENAKRNPPYSHNLKIIQKNIQHIRKKTVQIAIFLQETAPHILAISENELNENEILSLIIEGYFVVSYYSRKNYKGGGIALYVSNKVTQVRALDWIATNSIGKTVEVIGIDLVDMNCMVIVISRSPKRLLDDFSIA